MLYPLSYEGSRRNDRATIPADGYDRVLMADPLHTVARTLREAFAAVTGLPADDIDPRRASLGTAKVREVVRWAGLWQAETEVWSGHNSPASRVWVSHLHDHELAAVAQAVPDVSVRMRVGTRLWLGERGALQASGTVLGVHPLPSGTHVGYRQRSGPKEGTLVIVSGGTAHGIGLSAPTPAASMRQRVVIALALAANPKLIVADEPTTALDVSIQAQIIALLKKVCREQGAAVMLVTHDMGVIAETCDRVAVMYAGRVAEIGPVADVIHRPSHPYTVGLMGSIPAMDEERERLQQIDGAMPRLNAIPAGCAFNPRCARADQRCRSERPELRAAGATQAACLHALTLETPR